MEIYIIETKEKLKTYDITNMWQNILRKICRKRFPYKDVIITRDNNGKPFVTNIPEFHFNISHSGRVIAIAVDNFPVGVDIERVRDVNLKIVERFFSNKDKENFMKVEEERRRDYFFKMWTQKESYVKCIGKGFSRMPFRKFTIEGDKLLGDNLGQYNFSTYDIYDGYKMSVCRISHTDVNIII